MARRRRSQTHWREQKNAPGLAGGRSLSIQHTTNRHLEFKPPAAVTVRPRLNPRPNSLFTTNKQGYTLAKPSVVIIGGAPGAGKTTLGRALAARLDATSLTAVDLQSAAMAVTTPQSHPGLHVMSAAVTGVNSVEYFTTCTVDQLKADASAQHEAIWPAIESIIRKHAAWAPPIVIDGWYMRPEKVANLGLANVTSFWLVADPAVLQERERGQEFFSRSSDPEQMLQNFLGRSLWYNDLIRQQAEKLGLKILHQDGNASVEDLCAIATGELEVDG